MVPIRMLYNQLSLFLGARLPCSQYSFMRVERETVMGLLLDLSSSSPPTTPFFSHEHLVRRWDAIYLRVSKLAAVLLG